MHLHSVAGVAVLLCVAGMPTPSLAVRGIDAQDVERPPVTCAEALRLEIAEGHLKKADEIELRLANGESFEARYIGVNHDSLLLVGPEGDVDQVPSKYALRDVTGVARSRALFRPAWMGWGLVVGGLLGVFLTDEDPPGTATQIVDPRVGGAILGAFGGAILGSGLSLVIPMKDTYTCR
jgi:hypothetical protein